MSDNDETALPNGSLTFEALNYLAAHTLGDDTNETEQTEQYANELTTGLTKTETTVVNGHQDSAREGNNIDELHNSHRDTSNNLTNGLDKSTHSTSNGIETENDFDADEIQKKMNGVIQNIQSRKSVTSNSFRDEQTNHSQVNSHDQVNQNDSVSNHLRTNSRLSTNESTGHKADLSIEKHENSANGHHYNGLTPNSMDSSSVDETPSDKDKQKHEDDTFDRKSDHDNVNGKHPNKNEHSRPSSGIKTGNLDETAQFGVSSSPRVTSATSKRSFHIAPDTPSTNNDEHVTPTKVSDDTQNDVDRDNQEVATVARRPSRAMSPFNRPRSPTPDDSRKTIISTESQSPYPAKSPSSPTPSDQDHKIQEHEKKDVQIPSTVIQPASRRESTSQNEQQNLSRPTSAMKNKSDDNQSDRSHTRPSSGRSSHLNKSEDASNLIKLGDQLDIPSHNIDTERSNSPPPSSSVKSILMINPLLGNNLHQKGNDDSRSPSPQVNVVSNEKVTDEDALSSNKRRSSNISEQQKLVTDQKPVSRRESQTVEAVSHVSGSRRESQTVEEVSHVSGSRRESQTVEAVSHVSGSRRESTTQLKHDTDSHLEPSTSRRSSKVPQEINNEQPPSPTELQVPSRKGSTSLEPKPASRKPSTTSQSHLTDAQPSIGQGTEKSSRHGSFMDEQNQPSSTNNLSGSHPIPSRPESSANDNQPTSRRQSTADKPEVESHRNIVDDKSKTPSRRNSLSDQNLLMNGQQSTAEDEKPTSRRVSQTVETHIGSRHGSFSQQQAPGSRKPSTSVEQHQSSRRESVAVENESEQRHDSSSDEPVSTSKRGTPVQEHKSISRKESFSSEPHPTSKRGSVAHESEHEQGGSRRGSTAIESKQPSRKPSTSVEQHQSSRRESVAVEDKSEQRHDTSSDEPVSTSKRGTPVQEHKPISRKESFSSEPHPTSKRGSVAHESEHEQGGSRRGSTAIESKQPSRKPSTSVEQHQSSRRESIAIEDKSEQRHDSSSDEPVSTSKRGTPVQEHKPISRKESFSSEPHPTSKPGSVAHESEHEQGSRRGSTTNEPKQESRKGSVSDQHSTSKRGSIAPEQEHDNRGDSRAEAIKEASRKPSFSSDLVHSTSKRGSVAHESEQEQCSRRGSTAMESKQLSRKGSTSEAHEGSKHGSVAHESEQEHGSRRGSTAMESKQVSRKGSVSDQHPVSKRGSVAVEQEYDKQLGNATDEIKVGSRKGSVSSEQQQIQLHGPSSRRVSLTGEQQSPGRRASHFSENQSVHHAQNGSDQIDETLPSKPASRKQSATDHQSYSSRRTSTYRDIYPISPSRTSNVLISATPESSRRNSIVRDDHSLEAGVQSKVIRRSSATQFDSNQREMRYESNSSYKEMQSSDTDVPARTSAKHKPERTPSIGKRQKPTSVSDENGKRQKSSSTNDENGKQRKSSSTNDEHGKQRKSSSTNDEHGKRKQSPSTNDENVQAKKSSSTDEDSGKQRKSSLQRRSGQLSKRNSNVVTDETIVTPLIIDSSKIRQGSGRAASTTDDNNERSLSSKLPPVNSSFRQEQIRRSESFSKHQISTPKRSPSNRVSSSHNTTASDDEQSPHWTKKIPIPSINLTDDDVLSTRDGHIRPQSPNVEQIAERNLPTAITPITAVAQPTIIESSAKKRSPKDGQKRKNSQRLSRRSTSAESATHIRLVDDNSLDSTSENNTDFDQYKRRTIKTKKKDVETNTEHIFEFQLPSVERLNLQTDEEETTSQRPLKATKPIADHPYSIRRHGSNKENSTATPDSLGDVDAPTVRCTVKQPKHANQETEPVNVNVTVVVKRLGGPGSAENVRTTAEAFVEQAPQPYFEPVPQPPAELHSGSFTEEISNRPNEPIERPRSTEQRKAKSPEPVVEHHERHTQSDTEQIMTEQQKKRRRPKRISRTCQTYECVFRRMEREQKQDLRHTNDNEKNIQTRKSQLRPRKKSPRKNLPIYLSTDSFRVEELLPKQFHQSRRNASKSSSMNRSLSPTAGKLLILRPTLPFHHTDAVNVQRVCLQYAIDLVPNDNSAQGALHTQRNKTLNHKQPENSSSLPMIASSSASYIPSNRPHAKEKSASHKSEDFGQPRRNESNI